MTDRLHNALQHVDVVLADRDQQRQRRSRVVVLHQGRIVELGPHDELIARNGYYTDLYNKQLLEED